MRISNISLRKGIVLSILVSLVLLQLFAGSLSKAYAAGNPVVIDFEDLTTDGPGTGDIVGVTDQYSSLGVTFSGNVALDYSKGDAIPSFAHSGTIALEACYGIEFCTTPIAMDFTAPQTDVKVWIGYSSSLNNDRTVILRTFDATGAPIDQASTTLVANTQPIPIQIPLEVIAPNANISRAEVSFVSADPNNFPFNNNLAVDDVQFN